MKRTISNPSGESFLKEQWQSIGRIARANAYRIQAAQTYWTGVAVYTGRFLNAFLSALKASHSADWIKVLQSSPLENTGDFTRLLMFELLIAEKGISSDLFSINGYYAEQTRKSLSYLINSEDNDPSADAESEAKLIERVVNGFPKAVRSVRSAYGFHFRGKGYVKQSETERFILYQVLPSDKTVAVRQDGKPVLVVPPYVLGPNILAFLPGEKKSYVHAFANQGVPTYIRILKDIDNTEAVQVMTGEDDASDTKLFCELIKERHGRPVTLNGFCQGGYVALLDILSGRLDGLADALITCVAPIDGTRSRSMGEFLECLPERFRDITFSAKTLSSGNRVVDGQIMSWVYKLKSIEKETPLVSFIRDKEMLRCVGNGRGWTDKTLLAVNYWLTNDCRDIPLAITRMSFDSYTVPIAEDGTLPVRLFGRRLNLRRLGRMKIPWLICIAEKDDLVDREASLAPLKYVDAEVTIFPRGHVAMATSWPAPDSACALHKRFRGETGGVEYRGPVCFHLDLEKDPGFRSGHKGASGKMAA